MTVEQISKGGTAGMFTDDKFGSVSRDKYYGIIIVQSSTREDIRCFTLLA